MEMESGSDIGRETELILEHIMLGLNLKCRPNDHSKNTRLPKKSSLN